MPVTPDYEATITNVGGNQLGIYLPRDVVRILNIEKGLKVSIVVKSADLFEVRIL